MNFLENRNNKFKNRSVIDRRKNAAPIFNKYLLTGTRSQSRRKKDENGPRQMDRYSNKILFIILVILGLSLMDALFTLFLIDNGAQEVNPVMAFYINMSPVWFICVKYFLTSASLILVLFCKDCLIFKTRVKAKSLFYLFSIFFILVIQWQARLIYQCF